jgi:ribosome biogenesis GTPase
LSQPSFEGLRAFGWSDRVAALFQPSLDDGLQPARVTGVERGAIQVATTDDERLLAEVGLAVGDWVALDGPRVVEVIPRWSALERLDPDVGRQVMAANIDVVLIAAPADRLSLARVERELVVAWESGARPVVLITKTDVAADGVVDDLVTRLGATEVITTSAVDGAGLDEVAALLAHPTTAVLLGPSGAGKSTLVNALAGEELLAVGAVRDDDRRGRHTTSSRRLLRLPTGGSIIDMPGLRSLGTDAGADAVAAVFPEIDELAADCRFHDCSHSVEPGCAVVAAASTGSLDRARLASYRKLEKELAHERRRVDPVARQEAQRKWKTIHRTMRNNPKKGGR